VLRLSDAFQRQPQAKGSWTSMANCNFLTKAIEHVKKATGEIDNLIFFPTPTSVHSLEEDKAQNYPEALRLYRLSLDYFMTAVKCIEVNLFRID
jgi:hypothetical protein